MPKEKIYSTEDYFKSLLSNKDAKIFLQEIKNDSVSMVLTDPPYQISKKTGFKSKGEKGVERLRISMDFGKWDNKKIDEHISLITEVVSECYRVLKKGGVIVVFYDLWKIETLANILQNAGFRMLRFIEWVKTNPVPINSKALYLSNAREVAIVAVKGNKPIFKSKYHNGVFSQPIHRDGGKRIHPTQKPLALMRELISLHTNEGDIVLDPFAGSATTIIAALQLKREGIGCELNKIYFKKAINRLETLNEQS
jgi:site-specific DNA-methyltransferase (adenine-specific)